jgi:hypothetical protein
VFGALYGAADASLAGGDEKEILDAAINGGLAGAILGPLARIKFVGPVLGLFGIETGLEGTLAAIEQGNTELASFRAAFTLAGALTFIRPATPPPVGGRLGNSTTRAQIVMIASELKKRGWKITGGGGEAPETYLPGPGPGTRGGNYTDITATKSGKTLHINTIDTASDGILPTRREAAAAALIRSKIAPGDHLLLIPKD